MSFARDNRNIFLQGKKIPNGEPKTLIYLDNGIAKDHQQVYLDAYFSNCPNGVFRSIQLNDKKFIKAVDAVDSRLTEISAAFVVSRLIFSIFTTSDEEERNKMGQNSRR